MVLSRVLIFAIRYFNPIARYALASRWHGLMSGRLLLLSFTGRKTGRSYTTPVSYVREGNSLLVPAGGGWWRNLRNGRPATVRLRGTEWLATPEVITEQPAMEEVLRRMLAANPAISAFTGIWRQRDGRPSQLALHRERRRGFVVVRLNLVADVLRQAQLDSVTVTPSPTLPARGREQV